MMRYLVLRFTQSVDMTIKNYLSFRNEFQAFGTIEKSKFNAVKTYTQPLPLAHHSKPNHWLSPSVLVRFFIKEKMNIKEIITWFTLLHLAQ